MALQAYRKMLIPDYSADLRPNTITSPLTVMMGQGFAQPTLRSLFHAAVELVRLRQAMRETPGIGAVAAPIRKFLGAHALFAAGGVLPGQARLGIEGCDIGQLGARIFLQPYAAAARHLRHLVDREKHHLVVGADHRNAVAGHGGNGTGLIRHLDVKDLFALAGIADAVVLLDDEALPLEARNQELAVAFIDEQRHDGRVLFHIDEHPDRLAMAAAAGELGDVERIELAVGGEEQQLRGGLGKKGLPELVVGLEGEPRNILDMTFERTHPTLVGDDDGHGLALDKGLLDRGEIVFRRIGKLGAAFAERRFGSEDIAHLADLLADLGPLLGFRSEKALDALQFAAEVLVLGADLHFLELAQRTETHVEDGVGLNFVQLERLDQRRLRLVLGADDLDHLVDVQIGDQVTAEHFEPVLDLRLAVIGAADQHVAQMVEPFAQALGKPHHFGDLALDQHAEV